MYKKADGILDMAWDDSAGPFENILGFAEYGLVFIPYFRLGTIVMAALGLGPKNFGRWVDTKFNFHSVDDVVDLDPEDFAKKILDETTGSLEGSDAEAAMIPLSYKIALQKESISAATRRKVEKMRKLRSSPSFLPKFVLFIGKILSYAKVAALGGLGAASLKAVHTLVDEKRPTQTKTEQDIPLSIKERPNRVREQLENAIDKALSL